MTQPHRCDNCDGVDPDTCLVNPRRPATPTPLRDLYAAAIASYDHAVGQATDPAPRDHNHGQADAVLAVRDQELEQLRAQVERVRQLAERWENALTPDLAYARALRRALNGPPEQPTECPPGVHSMFDPCPGDCGKPLNDDPQEQS